MGRHCGNLELIRELFGQSGERCQYIDITGIIIESIGVVIVANSKAADTFAIFWIIVGRGHVLLL